MQSGAEDLGKEDQSCYVKGVPQLEVMCSVDPPQQESSCIG